MAKFLKFLLFSALTSALVWALNTRFETASGPLPPIGKFLDPFGGFWQNAESKSLAFPQEIDIPGLKDTVVVKYDQHLIPHVFARNDDDLYRVQGYLIAQFRLWQMEFQTLFAAGRISEIVGEKALPLDRTQRRKGFVYGARKNLEAYEKTLVIYDAIDGFSAGVNAYIEGLAYEDLPLEYKLLDYAPEEWDPLKVGLLLEYMVNDLEGWDNDLENTNAIKLFGKETFHELFPEYLPGIEPVVDDSTWNFEPIKVASPDSFKIFDTEIEYVLPKPNPHFGSNNWALGAKKTVNGNPLLANDTHLRLNLPSLWFLMQLHTPEMNVMGYTFTGNPGIIIGFTDSIAWGFTDVSVDNLDWYRIRFSDESRKHYHYDGGIRESTELVEEIKIRNAPTFYDTVIYTHHGPVVFDKSFPKESPMQNFAMQWTGHQPSLLLSAFYHLNRGESYRDYQGAIEFWDAPAQHIAFASSQGDISITAAGKYPVRWQYQGKFLLDGSKPINDWKAYIPKEQLPREFNPESAYVSSANQHSVNPTYPYYFFSGSHEYYRNRRINDLLEAEEKLGLEDMQRIQNDNYSLRAAEALPFMLDSIRRDGLTTDQLEKLDLLAGWDYRFPADSKAAVLFTLWYKSLFLAIWDEFSDKEIKLSYPKDYNTIRLMKTKPDHPLFDNANTPEPETSVDLLASSFKAALSNLDEWIEENNEEWHWSAYQAVRIKHPAIDAFSVKNVRVGSTNYAISSIEPNNGPSQRLIVELDPSGVKALGIYPGGQSGNPGSPYYDNFIDQWANGKYLQLLFMQSPEDHAENILYTQTFNPTE